MKVFIVKLENSLIFSSIDDDVTILQAFTDPLWGPHGTLDVWPKVKDRCCSVFMKTRPFSHYICRIYTGQRSHYENNNNTTFRECSCFPPPTHKEINLKIRRKPLEVFSVLFIYWHLWRTRGQGQTKGDDSRQFHILNWKTTGLAQWASFLFLFQLPIVTGESGYSSFDDVCRHWRAEVCRCPVPTPCFVFMPEQTTWFGLLP